ncbi:MAG: SusC/RagA family TonB-linked outer membrane protein [Prolixibacteraceae bacterium]|nr:SusC/RagA family TonB-linked outer membrane protein [Prolixibacteraceae bacterium]
MKLTTFLLFVMFFQVSAGVFSQSNGQLSLKAEKESVSQILRLIEDQTEYRFLYNSSNIDVDRKADINCSSKSIEEVLKMLFEGTDVKFRSFSSNYVLFTEEETSPSTSQQARAITGKVTDATGGVLPGVSVVEKGTTNGTITDSDGNYSLANVPANAILQFSFVGMKTQEVAISGKSTINVVLVEETIGIEEVVAVGYGNKSARKVLTSVSKVDTEKLNNASYSNMGQALSGISPGLILKQSGGGPGGDVPSISIRGGGDPLYVIDGVTSNKTDFARLSPSDIGNISVLKDAGAAAIYGARAANGVILIETKKAQGNSVSYSNMFSYASLAQKNEPLSSYDYATFNNKIGSLYGLAVLPWSEEAIRKFKDGSDPVNYPNTNWMDLTVGVAPSQKHNLSVSGTEKSIKYLFSLSLQEQNSMYKEPDVFKLQNYSVLSKITKDFGKSGLVFDFTFRGSMQNHNFVPYSSWAIFGHATNNLPYKRAYDDKGRYMQVNGFNNPVYEISGDNGYDKYKGRNFNGIAKFTWDVPFVKGLQFGLVANQTLNFLAQKTWKAQQPVYNDAGVAQPTPPIELTQHNTNSKEYLIQSYVNYKHEFGVHSVDASLFYEQSEFYNDYMRAYREGYISDAVDQLFAGPNVNLSNTGYADQGARMGLIGRFSYDYKDKYLLEHSFRYDGSDRFRKGDRFGYFPSLSLGWRFSKEGFFRSLVPESIVNDAKLRLSYGESGRDDIARYAFLSTFQPVDKSYFLADQWVTGYRDNGLPAGDITWYTQKSYNAGMEVSTLNNRLKGSVDAFYYRTSGHLGAPKSIYSTPLGTSLPQINKGAERRGGYEFNIGWNDKKGDFEYGISFNLTHYERFWELNPGESESTLKNPWMRSTYESNYTTTGYKNSGFFASNEDILKSPQRTGMVELFQGDIKFVDLNGDGIIDGNDQTRLGIGGTPDYYYGVNLNASYKGFYMFAVIQGASDYDMWLGGRYSYESGSETLTQHNQTDVWTPDNTEARFPRVNLSGTRSQNTGVRSEVFKVNMGYVRLKNIEIGYNIKKEWLNRVKIGEARVFVGGSNLFTYAPGTLGMYDPETGDAANYAYPVEKMYSFGVNLKF